jgi:hypothetical protein
MHRTLALAAFVCCTAAADATDSLEFLVGPGTHEEAGFGELAPGEHDLTVTYTATQGQFFYSTLSGSGYYAWTRTETTPTRHTYKGYDVQEDAFDGAGGAGYLMAGWAQPLGGFTTKLCSLRLPCFACMSQPNHPACTTSGYNYCSLTQEGELPIRPTETLEVPIKLWSGPGTVTIYGDTPDLEVLNLDGTPFDSLHVTGGNNQTLTVLVRASEEFDEDIQLQARFLPDNGTRDTQDVVTIVRATPLIADIDVDSNNDGYIDESDDPVEAESPVYIEFGSAVPAKLLVTSPDPLHANVEIDGTATLWLDANCTQPFPDEPQQFVVGDGTSPTLPSQVYVRADVEAQSMIRLVVVNAAGGQVAIDTVLVYGARPLLADIDVDSNNDGFINPEDDPIEAMEPGAVVRLTEAIEVVLEAQGPPTSRANVTLLGNHVSLWLDVECEVPLPTAPQDYSINPSEPNALPSRLFARGDTEGPVMIALEVIAPSAQEATDIVAVLAAEPRLEFRAGQPPTVEFTPAPNAKLLKGQEFVLGVHIADYDDFRRVPPVGNWNSNLFDEGMASFDGHFTITLTLTNATFLPGPGETWLPTPQRTFTMLPSPSGLSADPAPLVLVSPTWDGELLTVTMTTHDALRYVELPGKDKLAPGFDGTEIQDSSMTVAITYSALDATDCPTTQTAIAQSHRDVATGAFVPSIGVLVEDETDHTILRFQYGPDRNGPSDSSGNYEGVTVVEFPGPCTTTLQVSWFTIEDQQYMTQHGLTPSEFLDAITGMHTGVFTIGADDCHDDNFILSGSELNQLLAPAHRHHDYAVSLTNSYYCPAEVVVGPQTADAVLIGTVTLSSRHERDTMGASHFYQWPH